MPIWIVYGLLSAASAALVAIFAKIGIARVDSILATAIRAVIMASAMIVVVLSLGKLRYWPSLDSKAVLFIVLSGLAGAASWVWYFLALKNGPIAGVVALDRLSIVFAIVLAALFLGERLSVTSVAGMMLVVAGAILLTR